MKFNFGKNIIEQLDRDIHPLRLERANKYFKRILLGVLLIFFSVFFGVMGYHFIGGIGFLESLYHTIITISTVGKVNTGIDTPGIMIFEIILMVTNIGVFTYAISLISSFLIEGHLRKIVQDLIIGRKIDKMKNHIIICGYGRYGQNVANHLEQDKIPFVIIESNEDKSDAIRKAKRKSIHGNAVDEAMLKEAGIDHARAIITTLPVDADNVYVTLIARQLNPKINIVSRANEAQSKKNLTRAGADHVLIPENIGGFYMSALITKPDIIRVFTDFSDHEGGQFRIVEMVVDRLSERFKNKSLDDLNIKEKTGVNIIGLKKANGEFVVNPDTNLPLEEGSALFVLGDEQQIARFHHMTSEFELIK